MLLKSSDDSIHAVANCCANDHQEDSILIALEKSI